tara:strand:+ start:926 stop:1351 length:426 start_codon:yes stop_codon:yes gene_type:complete
MDFSDFSEFIGPLIFGIIAWLSNYFSKKKKPKQSPPGSLENKPKIKSKFEQIIEENFKSVRVQEKPIEEVEIIEKEEDKVKEEIKVKEDLTISDKKVQPKIKKETQTVIKESSLSKLRGKLKNKDSLKEAVILKEILDRKY